MSTVYFTACDAALLNATRAQLIQAGHAIMGTYGPYDDVWLQKTLPATGPAYVCSTGPQAAHWHVIHSTK
jgi:hypothetical protein